MIETNFKHTDIGVIPHDWEVKKLGAIYSFRYGIGNTNPNNGGKYPIYGANGVIGGYSKYNAEDSIVIGHMGEYAGSVLWAEGKHFVTYNGTITRPKEENSINAKYGFYALLKLNINNICAGSGYPFLAYDKLNSLKIPLPPTLAEQEKIANALSKIDQLINDLGALIEKKKAIKQGTMQDLLTAKRRLKGFTGEWKSVKLGDMCYFGKGKGLKKEYLTDNGRYKCILYGEIFTKYDSIIKSVFSRTNIEEGTYSQKGDVLMPGSTTTLGIDLVKAVVINENDVLLGGDVIILRPKDNQISSEFLAYLISNIDRNKVADVTQGITIIHLHAKNMTDIAYLIPPTFAEQNAIANILSSMDTEITNLEQKRDKYIAIKQGMMQNLLTGKIRLI